MASQGLQAVAKIPPFAYHNDPIDIYISIYREGEQYGADIVATGRVLRVPIKMSVHDLAALNEQLSQKMKAVINKNTTKETQREKLLQLAEIGHYTFKQVFNEDAQEVIQKLLAMSQRISIEISSDNFFLPWELIYPLRPDVDLSYEHFWGMNYIVSRVFKANNPGAWVTPVISICSRLKMGLLTDSRLPSVVEKEIPFLEKLEKDGKIHLFKLRPLNPTKKQEEFRKFREFWNNAMDIAHFACHALRTEPPNLSHIRLSNNFPITVMDLEVYGITVNGHPLIIMNACETGNLNPLYTSHFAAAFLKCGVRGVVATECTVPDTFAADFAEQLYAHLFAGELLGESLLATRRSFLEKDYNPSGLLYSMYASPSIRLSQIQDRETFA